jgi:Ca-activated chloride channel family protein
MRTLRMTVLGLVLEGFIQILSPARAGSLITLDGSVNYPYMSSSGGGLALQVAVTTDKCPTEERRPMNLSVVLDRSGSMGDEEKMEFAKKAVMALVDRLERDDILSIIIYDDMVEILRPAGSVTRKDEIRRCIEQVTPRNSTNLGGGMMEGLHQVECNAGSEYVNRVILISDGLANRGITDPRRLNEIARRFRARSISLTTMGVGLAYNENLMVGLAESGGGNYYFIESPGSLASIMRSELQSLTRVVAQDVSIRLVPGRGVSIDDVIGCEYRRDGSAVVLHIGDLYSGERREWTVQLHVPAGKGSCVVAEGSMNYQKTDIAIGTVGGFAASVQYSDDAVSIEKNRNLEVQGKADIAVSTRDVDRAMHAIDEGRFGDAETLLKDARKTIRNSPASAVEGVAGNAVRAQEAKLQGYVDTLRQDVGSKERAKKAIQYENYRTQKNK